MTKYIYFVASIYILSSCAKMNIHADYDNSVNFGGYKTFGYIKSNNTASMPNIKGYSAQEMMAKGFRLDTINPELLISVEVYDSKNTTSENTLISKYLNLENPNWEPLEINKKEGSITITIIDRIKRQIVWQATAESGNQDSNKIQTINPKQVRSIFNNYPGLASHPHQIIKTQTVKIND